MSEKTPRKPRTKLTPPKRPTKMKWAEAESIWEAGLMTRKNLAEKMGVSERSITRHMSDRGLIQGSKAKDSKDRMAEAIKQSSLDDVAILAARIRETKEQHYKLADNFAKLTWEEILKAKRENLPVSTATNNLKALDIAFTTIKRVREEKWAVLGLNKEDEQEEDGLPELVVSEMTAEEVEAVRNAKNYDMDDLPDTEIMNLSDEDEDDEEFDDEVVEE